MTVLTINAASSPQTHLNHLRDITIVNSYNVFYRIKMNNNSNNNNKGNNNNG